MKKQHYTMVELLTVIAIIVVLAGLAFPAYSIARAKARSGECLARQRSVMMAVRQSMQDEKDTGRFYSPATGDDTWATALHNRQYITIAKQLTCPETDIPAATTKPVGYYAYGAAYTSAAKGIDFRGEKHLEYAANKTCPPSQLIIGGCSVVKSKLTDRTPGARMSFDGSETDEPFGQVYLAHRKAVNFFFLDGHSATVRENEISGGTRPLYYPTATAAAALPSDKYLPR